MATRCSSTALALALVSSLLLHSAGAGVDVNATCAKTPHPIYCTMVLGEGSDAKTAPNVRKLAEVAIRATARIGAAAGSYARSELDVVKDNALWQCLDDCADDIEEAVSHLDDTEGEVDDKQFNLVADYLHLSEEDTWSCDESCQDTPPSPVRTTALAKNTDFEKMMNITNALINSSTLAPSPCHRCQPSHEICSSN